MLNAVPKLNLELMALSMVGFLNLVKIFPEIVQRVFETPALWEPKKAQSASKVNLQNNQAEDDGGSYCC
jgi:hypothetical protein